MLSFELRCGYAPFRSWSQDTKKRHDDIQKKVMAMEFGKVKFPVDRDLQDDFMDLIRRLLVFKSSERLGVVGKVSEHRFFSRVDLEKVLRKSYKPPIKGERKELKTDVSVPFGDICFDKEFADF